MLVSRLGLTPETPASLEAAGIRDTSGLHRRASKLLRVPGITGTALYETIYRLGMHDVEFPALPGAKRGSTPTDRDLEMLRLRIVDDVSLGEIGTLCGVSPERVRQRLHERFGLTGEPPAAIARRRTGLTKGQPLERLIAQRLHNREQGMSMSRLLAVFVTTSSTEAAVTAVKRMEEKGLLKIEGDHVTKIPVLRRSAREKASRAGRSACSERTVR
jgi:hypothetical protein